MRPMLVVYSPPKNKKLLALHGDLMAETCKSFGAAVAGKPTGNVVVLSREGEFELSEYPGLKEVDCVVVGCDDDFESDDLREFVSIRIETPVNYFLWSGVALGIFLHEYHKFQRHNESNSAA